MNSTTSIPWTWSIGILTSKVLGVEKILQCSSTLFQMKDKGINKWQ